MALFEVKMPKLGESVEEATITKWFVKTGDTVKEDDPLLEIATDKVDSEIPSPVAGKIAEIKFETNEKIAVGVVIATINTDSEAGEPQEETPKEKETQKKEPKQEKEEPVEKAKPEEKTSSRFYSPLVKTIAKEKNISPEELDTIEGSGLGGRVRKEDVMDYHPSEKTEKPKEEPETQKKKEPSVNDEIIEMDRVRKIIAEHMVHSKNVAPHVTNFIDADVTGIALWREKHKDDFEKRYQTKLTFLPFFIQVTSRCLKDFPLVNASVDATNFILHKNVNIGIAVAQPSGNLIVPVIKNADQYSISGLALKVNELADKARRNKLSPDDISGGTFTISNFGTFQNITGTPIINQPQSAILATGNIQKKPAVLETPSGDVIAIRHQMILALSYDHRIIDGILAGSFLKKMKEYLENFEMLQIL